MQIIEPAACGEGYYRMDGSSGAVTFNTHDCVGVPDEFESEFASAEGYVHFTEFSAGSVPGNFSGEPLLTTMTGDLDVTSVEGVHLSGSFLAAQEIVQWHVGGFRDCVP